MNVFLCGLAWAGLFVLHSDQGLVVWDYGEEHGENPTATPLLNKSNTTTKRGMSRHGRKTPWFSIYLYRTI